MLSLTLMFNCLGLGILNLPTINLKLLIPLGHIDASLLPVLLVVGVDLALHSLVMLHHLPVNYLLDPRLDLLGRLRIFLDVEAALTVPELLLISGGALWL